MSLPPTELPTVAAAVEQAALSIPRYTAWRPIDGVLLLDKPLGLSSNVALQRARRLFRAAKAGHTGSLDPLASGMLPVCFGEATKVAGYLLDGDKRYAFRVALGQRTTTGDLEGEVAESQDVPPLTPALIAAASATMAGLQQQVPPMYSALKRDGRPLYELARQGIEVERAPRAIVIHEWRCTGFGANWVDAEVQCSKGTYVRVLAESFAVALGTVGHLAQLRRLWAAPFAGQPMLTLEALEALDEAGRAALLLPADAALVNLPAATLDAAQARSLARGQQPDAPLSTLTKIGTVYRLYGPEAVFLGLGECRAGEDGVLKWHAVRLFAAAVAHFVGSA